MEEEWMRDRALLCDLLQEAPDASPRTLAQAIGRSVSWVKKWRKLLAEGDPHDSSLFCSHSRAPCTLFPLGFPCHPEDRGDAPFPARELEACAWTSGLALLPAS